jgi:hypothetical protein
MLIYAHPVSTCLIQRRNLQTAAAIPRVLRPTYALTSAFFCRMNQVTTSSPDYSVPRLPLLA